MGGGGLQILADFDKLISEHTGNTRLICVIIVNMAYLPRRNFVTRGYTWIYSTPVYILLPNTHHKVLIFRTKCMRHSTGTGINDAEEMLM